MKTLKQLLDETTTNNEIPSNAKYAVKHWHGTNDDSDKADFKDFPSKKAAQMYIDKMMRYHKIHGHEIFGNSNYYELVKKK